MNFVKLNLHQYEFVFKVLLAIKYNIIYTSGVPKLLFAQILYKNDHYYCIFTTLFIDLNGVLGKHIHIYKDYISLQLFTQQLHWQVEGGGGGGEIIGLGRTLAFPLFIIFRIFCYKLVKNIITLYHIHTHISFISHVNGDGMATYVTTVDDMKYGTWIVHIYYICASLVCTRMLRRWIGITNRQNDPNNGRVTDFFHFLL
ncbi:hypothetical protein ACJX0J_026798 [Zea mays]